MASMKVSATGLVSNTCRALQSSQDDMACALAFSLSEMIDNLLLVKNGGATADEFFALYTFNDGVHPMADKVKKEHYDCMRDDDEEAA